MTVKIYDPCGDTGPSPKALTAPLDNLAGKRIGVLDNGKPNAMLLMEEMARLLSARTGGNVTLLTAKRTAAEAADPAIIERLHSAADVVLTGSADCGSCTSWSIYDVDQLESAGVRAVGVTTTAFEVLSRQVAATLGRADARIAVVPHPLGAIGDDKVRASAAGSIEQLIGLLSK